MSYSKHRIYEASGDTLVIAQAWQARRDATSAARRAFAESIHPDAKVIGTDRTFFGLSTDQPMDEQEWRPIKGGVRGATAACWEPNKKTKAGKALSKRLSAPEYRLPDQGALSVALKFKDFVANTDRGLCVMSIQGQKVGERMIIFVPQCALHGVKGEEYVPEGRLLKTSEYHALVEDQQDIERASKAS